MQILLISGISGAGKTVFVKELEDNGFFCVDNLPVPLLLSFVDVLRLRKTYARVAVVIDISEKDFLSTIETAIESVRAIDKRLSLKIVFLDARNEVLLRR